ncbi:MAG TPA: M12 family metallopeptidase [Candidatus Saccharimonadales bacterium]|nr:M12 family metallopeptidase [Candidatus Saccharimonadales bacterium]
MRTALISGSTFYARPVQYAVVDGLAMFEGDIVLGTVEEVEATTARLRSSLASGIVDSVVISGAQFRWPDCTVPFTIDAALPDQARVTDAIAHWQANTGFRFVARTTEVAFVTFRPGTGCSSNVGRQGNQQFITLEAGCTTGNTIHEIGHAIGFWHEQSREDRDAFVTIHWDKIQPGREHNFNQHITDGDDVGGYDYGSIMHYPRDAFSVDGSDTITPIDAAATIGQRTGLSAGDIASANVMCPIMPTIKESPADTLKEVINDTKKELIADTIKEQIRDTLKEQIDDTIKEQIRDTFKEQVDDTIKEQIRDTRKEQIDDTIKEQIRDTFKEQVDDTIKEGSWDPTETWVETINPGGLGRVVNPVVNPGVGGLGRLGGGQLPFAMTTRHQAPGAIARDAGAGGAADAVAALDAQLVALAEQLNQLEAARTALQGQYDELAAALQQAMAGGGQGGR